MQKSAAEPGSPESTLLRVALHGTVSGIARFGRFLDATGAAAIGSESPGAAHAAAATPRGRGTMEVDEPPRRPGSALAFAEDASRSVC
jgi:hypothetical protein